MAKIKIKRNIITEIETEFEYPVYLYFQDDMCNDALIKVDEKYQISITTSMFETTIKKMTNFVIEEYYLIKYQTTKEHFDNTYMEVLKQINELI